MSDLASLLQSADSSAQQPTRFQIPRSDGKPSLQAYLWRSNAGKSEDSHVIIFTHGAGGTCLSPTAAKLCSDLAASCIVIGFDGSSNLKARTDAFMQVIEWSAQAPQVGKITLCGRSMGSRAATLAYAQTTCTKLSRKLILESYPLIGNGEEVRKAILLDLPDTADVMFCQGTEDDMCPSDNLTEARGQMNATSTSYTVVGLDHGMSCKRKASKMHSKAVVADMLHTEVISKMQEWLDAPASKHTSHDRWLNLNEDVPTWINQPPETTPAAAEEAEPDMKACKTLEVSAPARQGKRKVTQQVSVNHSENGPELAEPSLRRSKRSRKLVET